MKRIALWVVLFLALPIFLSAQTVTITPSMVVVQLGQPLYCAARYTAPNVQLYCYTSSTGHTWDLLVDNEVMPLGDGLMSYEKIITTTATFFAHWLFYKDPLSGMPAWAMSYGTPTIPTTVGGMGTFQ